MHRGTRIRVLIVLGIRHYEVHVVCHCFPRRLCFRWVLRDLATHLVLDAHRGAMKNRLGPDWDSNLGPLIGSQLPYQMKPRFGSAGKSHTCTCIVILSW
ncbi:hypothetical protein PoB_000965700 [Plakobranchus ocellatus]|uniref:Secreted protein n=1 Tax=Plakobranchus ocellatus TaxID=259542 RepID=A0AAV3YLZ6_9GAST|nr:hypothetical protein PoB_000965700 [Plakobranchus ocellatus]